MKTNRSPRPPRTMFSADDMRIHNAMRAIADLVSEDFLETVNVEALQLPYYKRAAFFEMRAELLKSKTHLEFNRAMFPKS